MGRWEEGLKWSASGGVTRRACSALTRGSESRDATRYAAVRLQRMIRAWKAQIRALNHESRARFPSARRFQGLGQSLWIESQCESEEVAGYSARTFLGRDLVWCLVALGLTCVAARTTRRTGAPMEKAILLLETCVSGEVIERRSEDGGFFRVKDVSRLRLDFSPAARP